MIKNLLSLATLKTKATIATLVVVMLIGFWSLLYLQVKRMGYQEATAECVEKFAQEQILVDTKITELQQAVQGLSAQLSINNDQVSLGITKILERTKKTPVAVIKEGKCTTNPEFINDVNSAIELVNQGQVKK